MPIIRLSTEYESKYNRQLWDRATRSNYFKLVDDRRKRSLRASCHAPIHWEHVPEIEEIKILTPEPFKEPVTTLAQVRKDYANHTSKQSSPTIHSRRSPTPPKQIKSAWGKTSSRTSTPCSEFEHFEWKPEEIEDQEASLKRTVDQRSPNSIHQDRKKLKTPLSVSCSMERKSSLPQSAPAYLSRNSSECSRPISRDGSVSSRSVHSRPISAASSRLSLDYEKTHADTTKSKRKNAVPFVGKSEVTRNVKEIPRSFDRYSAMKNKEEKVKLDKIQFDGLKDGKYTPAIGMTNIPNDMTSWVTEYQGNFKYFKPF